MNPFFIIVGAGSAGIGMGILLKQLGIENFGILERDCIGSSFRQWPKEMRFITPSFVGQGFGALDLNAVSPTTSPAYTLQKERLSGEDYALYLDLLAEHFDLPIREGVNVEHVFLENGRFQLETNEGKYGCDAIIWATGEYQFPNTRPFPGAEYALHNRYVDSWRKFKKDCHYIIIGGYESGIDAAVNLVSLGNEVTVISKHQLFAQKEADPSVSLAPYTWERLREAQKTKRLHFIEGVEVEKIEKQKSTYTLFLSNNKQLHTKQQPILATGFRSGAEQIYSLFEWGENGKPKLTVNDESTLVNNLFLIGPSVAHEKAIFCFIYKFRQRFAVVAKQLVDRFQLPHDEEVFRYYEKNQMYLTDLSCCEVKCEC
ncbi:NAD(P)/FAD-dependent oxidoreductase [Anoxybacillus ayderensis]|uniref:NAD(P)/FAD-dependent oxidoreductase n=1 Tax=Anoxybacillus ayderensis TaxID=265546 RepID=UPI000A26AA0F|nr:NAD(P)/FAD-dependent oxidoreductase [Anoxybacillus ayderensis]OSX53491.1 NAD-binding site protein [Anoxybacillus ayderensis]